MLYLPDTDVIVKLAKYGLLKLAADHIFHQDADIEYLRETFNTLSRPTRISNSLDLRAKQLVANFLPRCTIAGITAWHGTVKKLEGILGIDEGEIMLLYAAMERSGCLVLISDYRFLKALDAAPNAEPVKDKLASRAVCIEQLILDLIATLGCETVSQLALQSRFPVDTVIDDAFQSGMGTCEHRLSERVAALRLIHGKYLVGDDWRQD